MKKLLALLLAGLMAVSVAGCASAPATSSGDTTNSSTSSESDTTDKKSNYPGTPDADMVTVDLRADVPDMNPTTTSDVASADILRMTTAGLYKLDENDQPVPDLAEETTVSEDGLTYTFKLRKDAKWNNGDPVMNCTPFVRQYGILDNKWGDLLCRKEYQTRDTRQSSSNW